MTGDLDPCLFVPALPTLEDRDWEKLEAALVTAPALPLGQAWRPSPEETFRPGVVRLGWHEGKIVVAAKLEDQNVFTRATTHNQRLWELGDVFEMFFRNAAREDYLEVHAAPGDQRLQFHFPSRETVAGLRSGIGRLEDFVVQEPLFDFRTRRTSDGWVVVAEIPGLALGFNVSSLKGEAVLASFSRYDYASDGSPPVLSSTSPHRQLDFHRQEEWMRLVFC
ncbi:MAG TPA: hypothetical protein VFS35_11080 [Terrimicrobiaceae bacterium]|nr:hypothetical protein [Terrimicrobiaceae bacterium]